MVGILSSHTTIEVLNALPLYMVYIHIGTLFAKLTKTAPSLHMHRYLSAINSNEELTFFQTMQIKEAMYIKKKSTTEHQNTYIMTIKTRHPMYVYQCSISEYNTSIYTLNELHTGIHV